MTLLTVELVRDVGTFYISVWYLLFFFSILSDGSINNTEEDDEEDVGRSQFICM